ncbi:MAG: ankyrin repeat domain-containing protein [Phycisphaerae bacterium]|nr:ankyrin repeat domain-containing protein [Phycisphaerae bacterium]
MAKTFRLGINMNLLTKLITFSILSLFLCLGCHGIKEKKHSNAVYVAGSEELVFLEQTGNIAELSRTKQYELVKVAVENDWQILMRKLLEANLDLGTDKLDVPGGMTALHIVKSAGMAKLLLEKGVEADIVSYDGCLTPLHIAKDAEIADILVRYGADINAMPNGNETPLYIAAGDHNISLGTYLLSKGADANIKTGFSNDTALFALYRFGNGNAWEDFDKNKELMGFHRKLLQKTDINIKDDEDNALLHFAPTVSIAELLIDKGADINASNKIGIAPLHNAIEYQDANLALYLLSKGANVYSKNNKNETVLHNYFKSFSRRPFSNRKSGICISKDKFELYDKLLKNVNVNVVNDEGETVLHLAAGLQSQYSYVKDLLEKNAKINIQDNKGQTPAHYAASCGNWNNLKELIDAGADLTIKDSKGKTPMDILRERYPFIIQ